jgi:hypothetical protein
MIGLRDDFMLSNVFILRSKLFMAMYLDFCMRDKSYFMHIGLTPLHKFFLNNLVNSSNNDSEVVRQRTRSAYNSLMMGELEKHSDFKGRYDYSLQAYNW